ncbi:MAG: leucyl/phenylalanyl-tRNA--protein transferase [Acidimicrobiales bacterium]
MSDPGAPTWTFPPIADLPDDDLVAFGADLSTGTLVAAYRAGYFPMPLTLPLSEALRARKRTEIGWFHPVERGVLVPARLHVSRSLRRSLRRFTATVDRCFSDVVAACGDPARPHGWIDRDITSAYTELHRRGVAHSIEIWDHEGLAGGLYGVAIGGLFAGESMFHHRTDASKAAMVALVDLIGPEPERLIDVQWLTDHLASMGCERVERADYVERLDRALELDLPEVFRSRP